MAWGDSEKEVKKKKLTCYLILLEDETFETWQSEDDSWNEMQAVPGKIKHFQIFQALEIQGQILQEVLAQDELCNTLNGTQHEAASHRTQNQIRINANSLF